MCARLHQKRPPERPPGTILCSACGCLFPANGFPWRCNRCGGRFALPAIPRFSKHLIRASQPGIWAYRHWFPVAAGTKPISLGEGGTPLVPVELPGGKAWFKLEMLNPTGSFKDRGSAVLAGALNAAGVLAAVEDSSGNAGASFAAYAARAGISARVFIPVSASGPKRSQIESAGAVVTAVPGPRSESARAVLEAAAAGSIYASHAYLPHGLAGIATIAFEVVEQLGRAPAVVVAPAGHGSLIAGLWLGFTALLDGGIIRRMPRLIAVQAAACAPLRALFLGQPLPVSEGETIAEGIRVTDPARASEVLRAVRATGGSIEAVGEEEIRRGRIELARRGLYVESTSAVVWPVMEQQLEGGPPRAKGSVKRPGPIVAIISGHGLKTPNLG